MVGETKADDPVNRIRQILCHLRKDPLNGTVFFLTVTVSVLCAVNALTHQRFFWVLVFIQFVNLPLLGILLIRDRRRRLARANVLNAQKKLLEEGCAQLKFWEAEVNNQYRAIVDMILSGECGLGVLVPDDGAGDIKTKMAMKELHIKSVLETLRSAINRQRREFEAVQAKWIEAGIFTKEELQAHGQKK